MLLETAALQVVSEGTTVTAAAAAATATDSATDPEGLGDDYQKVEFPVLYWHKTTGYYYDPVSILYLS